MEIVLATGNKDKVREIKKALTGSGISFLSKDDLSSFPKVKEDGRTLEENAVKKARILARHTGKISLADDTGLFVKHLKGKPGVYSSRFAGYGCTYADNNRKLLKLLAGVKKAKRTAEFRCVIAIASPLGPVKTTEGRIKGHISDSFHGKNGFGYDPVFIPNGSKRSFAQIPLIYKNRISHRGRSLRKAKKLLEQIAKKGF